MKRKMMQFTPLLFLFGCKMHSLEGEVDRKMVDLVPRSSMDSGYRVIKRMTLDLDSAGVALQHLVLGVDYLEPPKKGEVSYPKCLKYLPGSFVIGELSCRNNASISKRPLRASEVQQACFTAPEIAIKSPGRRIQLSKCRMASVSFYSFTPELRLALSRD